jgi:molecular chaperone HscC
MIIGIDLGTTNSLVSYFSEQGPKIIPNRLGSHLTPSVVSIDENNQVYVGETAKERDLLYPGTSARVFKRDMGSDRQFQLGNRKLTAEELSSMVLRALREDAEAYLKEPVTEAVISVPAYFNDLRRKATKRAGELAGLKVDRIISEPTAAAVAYGLYQDKTNTKFLVFDLGGGTFDVSILELYDSIIEVRAVAGDNFLGGEDFTNVLEQMFFEANSNLDKNQLSEKTRNYIHKQMEHGKLELSDKESSTIRCNVDGKELTFSVEMADYEKACGDLLERIRVPIKRSLADANIRINEIDKVVLVGGATKQPMIRKFVSKLFGMLPDTSINPDEAVALGAAIQGAMKERNTAIREVILTDVCPFTLGTEVVVDRGENWIETGHFCPIIERNTTIPTSRTERLYTVYDNQKKIRVNILQGESRFAANNLSLGELSVEIPKGKRGEEAIDVTYTYDVNSILEVVVKVVSTEKIVKQVFRGQYTNMTEEEIQQRLEDLSYLKISPRDREENKLLLLRGERLYEETLSADRQRIDYELQNFEHALKTQDRTIIDEARSRFKKFLDEYETL